MNRPARATIDSSALAHNLDIAKRIAGSARVIAVIKADAYGHGMVQAATSMNQADGFAVASIGEGIALREAGIKKPLIIFQGAQSTKDYRLAETEKFTLIVHCTDQIELLKALPQPWPELWLEADTGMGRMGIAADQIEAAIEQLGDHCTALMSHLACADDPADPLNQSQIALFEKLLNKTGLPGSLLNSAGLMSFNNPYHAVRPGIMLYGASPTLDEDAETDFNLKAVMTLTAPVIAIHPHKAGDSIGYGADYICERDMTIGIVAIGYGDGYPRHAASGTPVLIHGVECPLAGRVSMDLLTVDLSKAPTTKIGDLATLWGNGLSVDQIAAKASTIAYELLCTAGAATKREWTND